MIIYLISFMLFGLIVGVCAKLCHPGDEPVGFFPTIMLGLIGSYIGGFINFLMGFGHVIQPSGFLMSLLGSVLACVFYSRYHVSKQIQNMKTKMKND